MNKVIKPRMEGYNTANWILLDYNDIIIHIFNTEDRLFYDLERIGEMELMSIQTNYSRMIKSKTLKSLLDCPANCQTGQVLYIRFFLFECNK